MHTTASDGTWSPAQAVDVAAARGLGALAITDHDTVSGIAPAGERAARRGAGAPEVVPGVEVNTDHGDREIHILGYFIDHEDPALAATLGHLREGRLARVERMLEKLASQGLPLSLDTVVSLCEEGSVGRPHVARAMVKAGYVSSVKEAFGLFLARGRPAYVARMRFSPFEAVVAIHRAGGVAVLAHPGAEASPGLIRELVAAGLGGLEVGHPDHDHRQEQLYRALASEAGLVATAGSDSHGPGLPFGADLGTCTVDIGVVEELRRRGERRRGSESQAR